MMAVRKAAEDVFVVEGDRSVWADKCEAALYAGGFTNVAHDRTLGQLHGQYRKATAWGSITVTLLPEVPHRTRIQAKATANVDNVFALFRSPTGKVLEAFKAQLS